ncbi:MAG: S1C family serine protease [Planctomycetes bacterium]|nr:S1C family serine protease [Planctomycetota bacterium]
MPKSLFTLLALMGLVGLFWTSSSQSHLPSGPSEIEDLSSQFGELASRVMPSTVFLRVDHAKAAGGESGAGTGFVMDAVRGLVITNAHVVGEPKARVRVEFMDGRQCVGDAIGLDKKTDLAVVRIPEGFAKQQLQWGDSDRLQPGHWVMAVGNPLGLNGTASLGVVSGLHRVLELTPNSYEDFLQHDAFIDHGSSGGPLVDTRGQVVGVNTAIGGKLDAWQGISYSVPARLADRVTRDLMEYGEVRRAFLGVRTEDLAAADARSAGLNVYRGALVTKVQKDTPAARGGLQVGDIILSADGIPLAGGNHLRARVGVVAPGDVLQLEVWRSRKRLELNIELARQP